MSAARRQPTPDQPVLQAFPDLEFEEKIWQAGQTQVAGIDEAGRGALAGPVAAAAVILPPDPRIGLALPGVRDSKQMTARQRDCWAERIRTAAVAWAVGFASAQEIDSLGILPATRLAVWRALQALPVDPQHLLLDYLRLPGCDLPQTALVKGDCRCLSIAAASVLAKTARDRLMRQLDALCPGYGLAAHKGYGTALHLENIHRMGLSQVHRKTFRRKEDGFNQDT